MASVSGDYDGADGNGPVSFSYLQKTVCLQDWWLIKAEKDFDGKRLAVAGFASNRKQPALGLFSSAPILKSYDIFTLETSDGICVILKGFMNKTRTLENGFPSEVCDHFVIGFPLYWERFAENCLEKGSARQVVSIEDADSKRSRNGFLQSNTTTCTEPKHRDRRKTNLGVEGCEGTVLGKVQHENIAAADCSRSSVGVPKGSPVTTSKESTSAVIVAPESLSCKRSRSGRLLLPSLEFWRNQTAVYNMDREVTGVKEGPYALQPSKGSKSEPQRKRKQHR